MTETLPLDPGQSNSVQVWLLRLDGELPEASRQVQWLSSDERERSERFRFPRDRRRFVVCRTALRSILGERLAISPTNVRFDYGEYGRPTLTGDMQQPTSPYFNVSHCHNLGCIAVASSYDVGVDVEAVRPLNDLDLMIRKTLSVTEQRHITTIPASDQLKTFFRYWTLKEALLKVVGVGLQWPLRGIEIDLGIRGRVVSMPGEIPARGPFLVQELHVGNDYCGALATESEELPQIEYRNWPSGGNEIDTEPAIRSQYHFGPQEALD